MASLMERLREWLAPAPHDDPEHEDIRRRLADHKLRIARIDAELAVRPRHRTVTHPQRRAEDR